MSYNGHPAPGNRLWPGDSPGNSNGYAAQDMRPQYMSNVQPSPSYSPAPAPTPQYWGGTANDRQYGISDYSRSAYHTPSTIQPQPQAQQPQFIQPSQLFQQPPTQSTHLHPADIIEKISTPSFQNSTRMITSQNDSQPDKSVLLISLAEEFFEAAHKLAPSVSISMTPVNVETYERLIATGLGCLDIALKRARLPPRTEANVRLRYAGVLYEETENFMEAETALSKGIALCERHHYFDLKYAMQFLLTKLMSQKNPKAAMKALDGHISEAEAYQHFSWVYALRFLRASYAAESGNPSDNHAAIQNLQKISDLAIKQSDRAIQLTASLVEAMVHLKSASPDSIEHVQRAIAAARAHQLNLGSSIPQLNGLTHIIDVMCSLREGKVTEMLTKLRDMQKVMDEFLNNDKWSASSDVMAIPINRTPKNSQTVSHETRAVLGIGEDGRDNLMMSFLNKRDAYGITYLISAVILLHKNPSDNKALKYLQSGLGSVTGENSGDTRGSKSTLGLLPDLALKQEWRGQILCYFRLYMGFCAALLSDWQTVKQNVDHLKSTARYFDIPLSGPLECLTIYLTGVYHQGIGDLDAALHYFRNPRFDLSPAKSSNPTSTDQVERDFALLAALNILWILQDPKRQNPAMNTSLIAQLEPFCAKHPNTDIQTAFNLVKATVNTIPPPQLFTIKKYLGAALSGAQTTFNTQFLCITLNVMCSRFFSNVVGDQAEKSAKAASVQAQKSGSALWRSVADGMLARCYEVQGKESEAQASMEQARKLSQMALPGR
ncbi:Uncharacterized protein BP5553_06943 [Venustampulla echinocandica]|uniref:TPR-like protein n=1 Tax=Venustampulla echinocandica TaxID=2656787 RepID=A0A370TI29_9HELO|nr:Uncharacterized protein BP5553_06943 [Venustampulla echinocandica]RDL35012.1 Uncharacterized protein BP5553_06943 [Venustampulla echinocandica]